MKLRIGVHYDLRSEDSGASDVGSLIAHAVAVEAAGADVVWVGERPTEPGAWIGAAFPVCAAIAVATERVALGTAVVPLLLHHPLRVAEDAATLDALSDGRFELGVGLGGDREALSGFGVGAGRLAERLDEALDLVIAAWSGPLDFKGRHFQATGIEVLPRPVRPGGPPVWVGGGAPAAQRRAARLDAGLILPAGASPETYLRTRAGAGKPVAGARLAVLLPESLWRDADSLGTSALDAVPASANGARVDAVLSVTSPAGLDSARTALAALHEAHAERRDGIY